jgi:hypothetical protein
MEVEPYHALSPVALSDVFREGASLARSDDPALCVLDHPLYIASEETSGNSTLL